MAMPKRQTGTNLSNVRNSGNVASSIKRPISEIMASTEKNFSKIFMFIEV